MENEQKLMILGAKESFLIMSLHKKLEEAGMSTVIAEMQRQLDAWIAEHPDWNMLERS